MNKEKDHSQSIFERPFVSRGERGSWDLRKPTGHFQFGSVFRVDIFLEGVGVKRLENRLSPYASSAEARFILARHWRFMSCLCSSCVLRCRAYPSAAGEACREASQGFAERGTGTVPPNSSGVCCVRLFACKTLHISDFNSQHSSVGSIKREDMLQSGHTKKISMWKLPRDLKVGPLDCARSALHTEPNFIFGPL